MEIKILALLLLIACASKNLSPNVINRKGILFDSELLPYVEEFERRCNCEVEVTTRFEPLTSPIAGVCTGHSELLPDIFKSIGINKEWWITASHWEKENLIFHELGHCVLNMDHDEEMIRDSFLGGRPKSIMYPEILPPFTYLINREEYLDRFFNRPITVRATPVYRPRHSRFHHHQR